MPIQELFLDYLPLHSVLFKNWNHLNNQDQYDSWDTNRGCQGDAAEIRAFVRIC